MPNHIMEKDFESVAQIRDNFMLRDAQMEFADSVYQFIQTKTPGHIPDPHSPVPTSLIAEAGTGTGKSLAYLLPIIKSGKKAIISTNTKALQKQVSDELKNLQKVYPTITFKVLQGAANYACLLKADGLKMPMVQNWISRQLQQNLDGMADSFRKKDQKFNKDVWSVIATDSKMCQESCPKFNDCFYQTAKRDAKQANIIILNHDLLLLFYKMNSDIFKEFQVIAIDEAHHFPEKARQTLSYNVGNKSLSKHIAGLNWKLENVLNSSIQFDEYIYQDFEEEIFDFIPEENENNEETIRLREFHPDLIEVVQKICRRIESDSEQLKDAADKDPSYYADWKRFEQLSKDLKMIFHVQDSNWIKTHSVKRLDGVISRKIEAIPLDIGSLLSNMFLEKSVTMTSATLKDGASFEFFKNQINQPYAKTISYPSPFSKKHVAVCIPRDEIDPNDKENYHKQLSEYMVDIHTIMHGRSLFLFTNREDLDECRKLLPDNIKDQFYIQTNTAEVPHMVKRLRSETNLSLVGLSTLWEGVDVVGQALSCVTIMRMPFANPDDVIFSALRERYRDANGGNDFGFFDGYDLPQMLLKLKQGIGRLVRHETDTGLLVLLDNRFMRKKYRNRVIELLEDYDCYDNIAEAVKAIPDINLKNSIE